MSNRAMIVAASTNDVIGVDGDLPWHLSSDLKRFKKLTMGHHLIMGRKTFDSIGRCLPGRTTVIVTRQPDFVFPGAKVAGSIEAAIELAADDPMPFIVGGAQIYALAMPYVDHIYLTRVYQTIQGDTYLPAIDWEQWEITEAHKATASGTGAVDVEGGVEFSFQDYRRRN